MNVRNWWVMKQLRAQVITDLSEFIPEGYFQEKINELHYDVSIKNSKHFSHETTWGACAAKIGRELFFESNLNMTARQVSAADVLMNLGMLVAVDSAQKVSQQLSEKAVAMNFPQGNLGEVAEKLKSFNLPIAIENLKNALGLYIHHLGPNEYKLYAPLLENDASAEEEFVIPPGY